MELPYIFPLFLGMTFDARSLRPGVDIFDAKYVNDYAEQEFGEMESRYSIVQSLSEVQNALNINGDLNLKIKAGMLKVDGKGSYLKNEDSFENKIEILTTTTYTSVVRAFKKDAVPREDWEKSHDPKVLGTHYVSEVKYGAELIASVIFRILKKNETEDIKAAITTTFNTEGNTTELFIDGKMNKLKNALTGKANMEILYYGTVPLKSVPNTLEGLETLINDFSNQVNLGSGVPMEVGFEKLSNLASGEWAHEFQFEKNMVLDGALNDFSTKFEELRQARVDLHSWVKALPADVRPDLRNKIGDLHNHIMKASQVFYETLWTLDITQGPEQLNKAFDAYDYTGEGEIELYTTAIEILKNENVLTNTLKESAGATYIRFGNDKCDDQDHPDVTVLSKGFVFGSDEWGIGGASKYECIKTELRLLDSLYVEKEELSTAALIRYPIINHKHSPFTGEFAKKVSGKGIPCTKCHSPYMATVTTYPGRDECPLTWALVYKGYLVSARADLGLTTEYVCLDEEPTKPVDVKEHKYEHEFEKPSPDKNVVAFTTVLSHGSLGNVEKEAPLRCVVCSLNSNPDLYKE